MEDHHLYCRSWKELLIFLMYQLIAEGPSSGFLWLREHNLSNVPFMRAQQWASKVCEVAMVQVT